ncbi:class II fructose-1,6-bisphosphate aldolase [Ureaplasma parvum]|uniref:class II fructose-1,6-bisphosphate aldolase n=1 Tax=Ureaplasma parvum TaxID=134821 RepID=UPI00114F74B3|nr:class II fructose-1,6-bisphosphate aldolase [Ureaplasma parvum]QDI64564.1 class II fructose-1,6-bisphosphate aldolase [Ureaplasma parvum]
MSPLVNAKKMIQNAYENHYAVAAININNLEWIKAALLAAQETNSPLLLATSEGAVKYMGGYDNCYAMVVNLIKQMNIKTPVCLHLDHGTYEGCIKAINAGYSSIMYDGSKLSIEENIKNTKELLTITKLKGVSVEVEVGSIGGTEDGITSEGELANIDDCYQMCLLDIDMLACGIGNIHGIYPKNWKGLNFNLLKEISNKVNKPIVLHGGSGISDEQILKAINLGVAKININTECQIAFSNALQDHLTKAGDLILSKQYDPRKILAYGVDAIKNTIIDKFTKFNSLNKIK